MRAIDVLVTVALEVADFIVGCVESVEDEAVENNFEVDGVDDDGALLETETKNKKPN